MPRETRTAASDAQRTVVARGSVLRPEAPPESATDQPLPRTSRAQVRVPGRPRDGEWRGKTIPTLVEQSSRQVIQPLGLSRAGSARQPRARGRLLSPRGPWAQLETSARDRASTIRLPVPLGLPPLAAVYDTGETPFDGERHGDSQDPETK